MDEEKGNIVENLPQKVLSILMRECGDDDDVAKVLNERSLFIQLDILCHFPARKYAWKELSRWLKYEEKVDASGRWSKPHVTTPSLHAINFLRQTLTYNHMIVDLSFPSSPDEQPKNIYKNICLRISNHLGLESLMSEAILNVLLSPHKHKNRHINPKLSDEKGDILTRNIKARKASMAQQRRKSFVRRPGKDLWGVYTQFPKGTTPDNLQDYAPNKKLMKKLTNNTEVLNILIGHLDFLQDPIIALFRFEKAVHLGDTTEVDLPTRFFFLALGNSYSSTLWEFYEVGRAVAAIFNDKVFRQVGYKANDTSDLLVGLDEYIDDLTCFPPDVWDPTNRLDPPNQTVTIEGLENRLNNQNRWAAKIAHTGEENNENDTSLVRTGSFLGGLRNDIKRKLPHYLSDFKDGFNMQCVASSIFLYFACITPIVTFGGLMQQKTDGYMGVIEMLLSGVLCGSLYALFSGQPLTIIGATGPLLVFEAIIFEICKNNSIEFMTVRFWIGMWVMLLLIIIVALDLSSVVRYITRFTEECFAVLISLIFIYESLSKLYVTYKYNPVHTRIISEPLNYTCRCQILDLPNVASGLLNFHIGNSSFVMKEECIVGNSIEVNRQCLQFNQCYLLNGTTFGEGCTSSVINSVPDVFLLSCVLLFGTFIVAITFRNMRSTRYFPMQVRSTLADFAVFLSVCLWTGVDALFGLNTLKLDVPLEFATTRPGRGWIINPLNCDPWWIGLLSILPAILATILLFLDQQITAVIINRKEHKLVKGHGYHLDLLIIAILVGLCSLLGLPWFCAATVRSISHVQSLVRESEVKAPGEKPQMQGIREQRLTGLVIHLLIGVSTLCAVVLRFIPMPVLYGVFLYMGITSLNGVQFIDRILILLMPSKYQPDHIYLRHVQTSRVHMFTLVQLICMALMWLIKSMPATAIAFPIMLLALMGIRKLLDFVFTQQDMYWLDHLLPDEHRRKREDLQKIMDQAAHRKNEDTDF